MPETSLAQLAANQSNAQLSTGPKSEEGKKRASLNALRHGLAGNVVVMPYEDLNLYRNFSEKIHASLQPVGDLETHLAQSYADELWRYQRSTALEHNLFAVAAAESASQIATDDPEIHTALAQALTFRENHKAFATLSVYAQRIKRNADKSLQQLQQLQAVRKAEEKKALEQAIGLHKLYRSEKQPFQPQDFGFVYSTDEIEHASWRKDRFGDANCASNFARRDSHPLPPAKREAEKEAA